ncbi:MAG: hypothetical protein KJ645_09695, partial [Planctomycetes bacterium]|nr:hypothetical protein [Planctomycetota bacterium]
LICSGEQGMIFEVTPQKEVVWKYVNPVISEPPEKGRSPRGGGGGPPGSPGMAGGGGGGPIGNKGMAKSGASAGTKRPVGPPPAGPMNSLFKVRRYGPDYPGLADKKPIPGKTIETKSSSKTLVLKK